MTLFKNEIEHWKKIIKNVKKQKKLMKFVVAFIVIAFIFLDFLFGIMKHPVRDIETLSIPQQKEYSKFQNKFRANQEEMISLERLDKISDYVDTKIPIDIKNLKKENLLLNDKMYKISSQADYKSWQYKLSAFMCWQYPFNLHKH